MPDRIDAVMDPVQPASRDPVIDRVLSDAEREELPPRDAPVLPLGQRGDRPVTPSGRFSAHVAEKCILARHERIVASESPRGTTRSLRLRGGTRAGELLAVGQAVGRLLATCDPLAHARRAVLTQLRLFGARLRPRKHARRLLHHL